jgi:hypothetical protein
MAGLPRANGWSIRSHTVTGKLQLSSAGCGPMASPLSRRLQVWHAQARFRAHGHARGELWPISELLFGTLTQNRGSLEPSLGFVATAGTPRIVDHARYVQAVRTSAGSPSNGRRRRQLLRYGVGLARATNVKRLWRVEGLGSRYLV